MYELDRSNYVGAETFFTTALTHHPNHACTRTTFSAKLAGGKRRPQKCLQTCARKEAPETRSVHQQAAHAYQLSFSTGVNYPTHTLKTLTLRKPKKLTCQYIKVFVFSVMASILQRISGGLLTLKKESVMKNITIFGVTVFVAAIFLAVSGTGYGQVAKTTGAPPAVRTIKAAPPIVVAPAAKPAVVTVAPVAATIVPKTAPTITPIVTAAPKILVTKNEVNQLLQSRAINRTDIVALQSAVIPDGLSFETPGGFVKAASGSYKVVITDIFYSNNILVGWAAKVLDPKSGVLRNGFMKGSVLQNVPEMMGNFLMRNQSAMMGEYLIDPRGNRSYGLQDSNGNMQWYNQRGDQINQPLQQGAGWSGGTMTPDQEAGVRRQFGVSDGSGGSTGYAGDAQAKKDREAAEAQAKKDREAAEATAENDDDDDEEEVVDSDSDDDETPNWKDWIGFVTIDVATDGRAQVSLVGNAAVDGNSQVSQVTEGGTGPINPYSRLGSGQVSQVTESGTGPINPYSRLGSGQVSQITQNSAVPFYLLTNAGINVWVNVLK